MIQFNRYKDEIPFPEYIQGIWWLENGASEEELPLISDGYPELMIGLKGRMSIQIGDENYPITGPHFIGIMDHQGTFHLGPNSMCVSVKLMPWALPVFIKDTAHILKNGAAPVSSFIGDLHWPEHLDPGEFETVDAIIENLIFPVLYKIIDTERHISPVLPLSISSVFQSIRTLSPEQTLPLSGSKRYYEKLYKEYVGLSPMRFKRLLKIKKASLLLLDHEESSISAIAAALGYFDLSHFNKDFQRFTGVTPSEYAKTLVTTPMHTNSTYRMQYQYS